MTDAWGTLRPRRGLAPGEIVLFTVLALMGLAVFSLFAWVGLELFAVAFDLPFNRAEVTVETEATVDGDRITVTGTTNLPDGTVLQVWIAPNALAPSMAADEVTVWDGAFSFTADTAGSKLARIYAYFELYVDPESQPASVTDRLGRSGERMHGPDVYSDSGDKYLSITIPIDLRQP